MPRLKGTHSRSKIFHVVEHVKARPPGNCLTPVWGGAPPRSRTTALDTNLNIAQWSLIIQNSFWFWLCVTPQRIAYYPCEVIYTQFGNHWFNVKFAFFTVFVVTLQTGFTARWCFWFSANDSTIEQVCPPLVYAMYKETWMKKKHCCQQSAFFAANAPS